MGKKPVTVDGVQFENREASYKYIGQKTGRTVRSVCWYAGETKLQGDDLLRYVSARQKKEKTVTVDGVQFKSRKASYEYIGQKTGRTVGAVCIHAYTTKLQGDELLRYVSARQKKEKTVTVDGAEFNCAMASYKYIAQKTGRTARAVCHHAYTTKLQGDELLRHIIRASISFRGKHYRNAVEFAGAHGLSAESVRLHLRAGNTPRQILDLAGKLKVKERANVRPTKAGAHAVRMSGWVWASIGAMVAYYRLGEAGRHRLEVGEMLRAGHSVGFAMMVILVDAYTNRNLDERNRLKPALEERLPKWCLPIDQPRLGPVDIEDRQATPDWAVMPEGARHAFYTAGEDAPLITTVRKHFGIAQPSTVSSG